jgi:curved DNA-binding protein CbpA
MATLYDKLGVRPDATEDEIKRAYRKAAMKWHPDRNAGHEALSRARFQEIKDAYAILSSAAERRVYDAVYAEEMRRWEHQRRHEERLRAEREAAAQAAAEAEYAEMVGLAMRFASKGYNRDVVFGVLLGRQCDVKLANRIADSVAAMHESSSSEAIDGADAAEPPPPVQPRDPETSPDEAPTHDQRPASVFETLWHNFFRVRS